MTAASPIRASTSFATRIAAVAAIGALTCPALHAIPQAPLHGVGPNSPRTLGQPPVRPAMNPAGRTLNGKPAPGQPAPVISAPPAADRFTPAQSSSSQPANPPQVNFDAGLLSIRAENATLNQILSSVSSHTGIHVDGSVSDERVYGNFGPASPAEVISRLLEGSPYNMILVGGSAGTRPTQLILTRRSTASVSNARTIQPARVVPAQDDEPDPEPEPDPPAPQAFPQNNPPAGPGFQDPSQQQPPNGLRTPQQIFNQLQQQRQQQQQDQITPQ